MRNNNQTNQFIQWLVTAGDFLLLNVIILLAAKYYWRVDTWPERSLQIFILVNNVALIISEFRFSTVIHMRLIGAGDVVQRIVGLSALQTVLAYALLKIFDYYLPIGWLLFGIGSLFFITLIFKRITERWLVRLYREAGGNSRAVTLVGSDSELLEVYKKLANDSTLGYKILGYYGDWPEECGVENDERKDLKKKQELKRLGSYEDFLNSLNNPDELTLGDELYLCVSRKERQNIRRISKMCDHKVVRFFYVPVSVETIGLNLKRELLDDMEVYTTYENPLQNSVNRAIKRLFDICFSIIFLIPTALIFPFVFVIIKIQSPGPLFFRQKRTGLDGKDFEMLKFRSMHVNKDADKIQATKDDPRKYPFGNFMRKSNIDELPQFLNVLKGDMSIVGPRPHMLLHTEMYSELIDKYMVRHFVKPGLTGWAQVTGFRGETKELWQMEGRVKRDIWYMEHWSIWLDIRIIWMTVKTIFIHDKNAY